MDNRLIFLYCDATEMWGRREISRAGNEEAGTSERLSGRQIPLRKADRNVETAWSKLLIDLPRKAAIVCSVPVP